MEALRSSIFSSGLMASSSPASSGLLKEEWRDGKEDKDADGEWEGHQVLKVRPANVKGALHRRLMETENLYSQACETPRKAVQQQYPLCISDTVVAPSMTRTKLSLPRPPSVCAPPLPGLCWFNPGGQQPGLTAPRHCHLIYEAVRASGADDHSGSTPAVLSATHHQGDDTLRFMAV